MCFRIWIVLLVRIREVSPESNKCVASAWCLRGICEKLNIPVLEIYGCIVKLEIRVLQDRFLFSDTTLHSYDRR